MITQLRSSWQKIKQHPFIALEIVVALLAIIAFILAVHTFGWDWTGFTGGESKIIIISTSKGITTAKEQQPGKALWDWLGLLATLAIPIVVGIGAAWFTTQQAKASDRENKDNQQETALQAYIDKISELLLKEHLGELTADGKLKPEYVQVRNIARVRTLTVLRGLDVTRKAIVLQYLHEADLINKNRCIINLSEAQLFKADLQGANLRGADLHEVNLRGADLSHANLLYINLRGADLSHANLFGANLRGANLRGANLRGADLSHAKLFGAKLFGAKLYEADLREAILRGATVTTEQLEKTKSLKGTTMLDGTIHL